MPSTNFIQFNPTESNQESDAAYAANALVTGGVQLNNQLPSNFLNKLWYQVTTFPAAFCQMLVNKGYSPMDTSVTALAAVLANVLTNADTQPLVTFQNSSTSMVFNRASGQTFEVNMISSVTSPTLVGTQPGQYLLFNFTTDGTAGHSFTWPSQIVGAGDLSNMAANTTFTQMFWVRADGTCFPVSALTQFP